MPASCRAQAGGTGSLQMVNKGPGICLALQPPALPGLSTPLSVGQTAPCSSTLETTDAKLLCPGSPKLQVLLAVRAAERAFRSASAAPAPCNPDDLLCPHAVSSASSVRQYSHPPRSVCHPSVCAFRPQPVPAEAEPVHEQRAHAWQTPRQAPDLRPHSAERPQELLRLNLRRLPPPPCWEDAARQPRLAHSLAGKSESSARSLSIQASEPYEDRNLRAWPATNQFLYGQEGELMGSILSAAYDPSCALRTRESSQLLIPRRGSEQRSRSLQATEPYIELSAFDSFRAAVSARMSSRSTSPASSSRSRGPMSRLCRRAHSPRPGPGRVLGGTSRPEPARGSAAARTNSGRRTPFQVLAPPGAASPRARSSLVVDAAEVPSEQLRSALWSGSEPPRPSSHRRSVLAGVSVESEADTAPYIYLPASAQWVQGNLPSSQPRRPWLFQEASSR